MRCSFSAILTSMVREVLPTLCGFSTTSSALQQHPIFLVLPKADIARQDVHTRARELGLAETKAVECEVVSVSALDGSGVPLLLHLLAWSLLAADDARQRLVARPCLGGNRLLHRTAGALTAQQTLAAFLQRPVTPVA